MVKRTFVAGIFLFVLIGVSFATATTDNKVETLPSQYEEADRLITNGDLNKAEVILEKLLSSDPDNYVALTMLGDVYVDRRNMDKALRLYTRAIEITPDYPLSHLSLGHLKFLTRDYETAIKELNIFKDKMKTSYDIDNKSKSVYVNGLFCLSEVYFRARNYDQVRIELENILKISPKEQDAYYGLGVYYYTYEHSRQKAYNCFKKAIDIDPKSEKAKDAQYAIEFMTVNPDSRFAPDLSFIDRE